MTRKESLLLITFCFAITVPACSKQKADTTPSEMFPQNVLPCSDELGERYTGGEFVFLKDVPYFGELVGDLYLPADRLDFPVVIHIHGGGWVAGSRRTPMAKWWGEFLACNGVAVFDIEYTLLPKARNLMQQVEEIRCAILWTQTEGRRKFRFGDKIIVMGGSAGGHLTALSTLKDDVDLSKCPWSEEFSGFPKISAAIPFYGIYDFAVHPLPAVAVDRKLIEDIKDVDKISPINYSNRAYFPFLIIHGTSDFIPLDQPIRFHRKLLSEGKDSRLVLIEGASHAFDVFPETEFTKKAKDAIYEFLLELGIVAPSVEKVKPRISDHISAGIRFLEEGNYKHAHLEFSQEQTSCATEYGKFISIAFYILEHLINAQDTSLMSFIPQAELQLSGTNRCPECSSHLDAKESSPELQDPDFNHYYENFIVPILEKIEKMEELSSYILRNSCKLEVENGVLLHVEGFNTKIRIGKIFGEEFPILMMFIGNLARAVLHFIFSHDINLKIDEKVFRTVERSIGGQLDTLRTLREAGYIYVDNPNILKFKRPELWRKVKGDLMRSLSYLSLFIKEAILDVEDTSDVFSSEDKNSDGEFSIADSFNIGIIDVEPPRSSHWFIRYLNLLQYIPMLGKDYLSDLTELLERTAKMIRDNSFINLGTFDEAIPQMFRDALKRRLGEENIFPEFVSLNVGGFLDAEKPLRSFLPEVVLYGSEYIFLIENEVGNDWEESAACYFCQPGMRFVAYDGLTSYDGKRIEQLSDDGVSLERKFLIGTVGIPYLYYKDPTFGESVLIRDDGQDGHFVKPDVFLMNKTVAKIFKRLEKIIGGE